MLTKDEEYREDEVADHAVCDPVEGLSVNQEEQHVQGHTAFVSEAAVCAEIPEEPRSHYSLAETEDNQSVKDFFARPRLISTGTITTGTGVLATNSIRNYADFVALFGPVAGDRLSGVAGFRCTLKFTLTVSATPFHQGILNFAWQYATNNNVNDNDGRGRFVPLSINLPHVMCDLAENTMVSLDIPYVSGYEYFALNNDNSATTNYGTWWLNKLTDVRVVAGQTSPNYNLYLSLHDIELIGVSPIERGSVILQAGTTHDTIQHVATDLAGRAVKALAKKGKNLAKSAITGESKAKGTYSGLAERAANVAHYASYIPGIGAIGGATEWFLRATSKGLSAFGYSKPNDETKVQRMYRGAYAGDAQVDMPQIGFTVSPFQSNKLAVTSDLGCDDEDHMAMAYVLSKKSYIFRGKMSSANNAGTLLYGTLVSPLNFWYRDADNGSAPTGNIPMPVTSTLTTNVFLPSTLLYLASNFRYWRGAIKFTIKFAKTKMHGGRVVLTYTPSFLTTSANTPASNTIPTPQTLGGVQPQGLSTIVDLKDNSEVEFVVPYLSPQNYLSCNSGVGGFTMHVINPLVAPATASDTIDFMVLVSAEPDFEFACIGPSMLDGPGIGTAAVLQSGLGGVAPTDDTSQLIIGEKIMSVKQLLMSPDYVSFDVANNSNPEFVLIPWFKWNLMPMATPIADNSTRTFYASKSSRLARMYSFVNGSTFYCLFTDGGGSTNITYTIGQKGNDGGGATTGFGNLYNRGNNFYAGVQMPETIGHFKAVIPTYSKYARIPTIASVNSGGWGTSTDQFSVDPGGYSNEFSDMQTTARLRNNSGAARRVMFGRAAADDARCAHFIGPPACCLFPSTKTVSPSSGAAFTIF